MGFSRYVEYESFPSPRIGHSPIRHPFRTPSDRCPVYQSFKSVGGSGSSRVSSTIGEDNAEDIELSPTIFLVRGNISEWSAIFSNIPDFINVGILCLPWVLASSGWVVGFFLVIFVSMATVSSGFLTICAQKKSISESYSEMVFSAISSYYWRMIVISLFYQHIFLNLVIYELILVSISIFLFPSFSIEICLIGILVVCTVSSLGMYFFESREVLPMIRPVLNNVESISTVLLFIVLLYGSAFALAEREMVSLLVYMCIVKHLFIIISYPWTNPHFPKYQPCVRHPLLYGQLLYQKHLRQSASSATVI